MSQAIDTILAFNRQFVAEKAYEPYITDKYPARKLAILTCMDTRLTELLMKALGLRNGDAKVIKNAGGLILSETDSAIRSLLVAIYELGVEEIMVIHHSTCGACHMSYGEFKPHMLERGIAEETLATCPQDRCGHCQSSARPEGRDRPGLHHRFSDRRPDGGLTPGLRRARGPAPP